MKDEISDEFHTILEYKHFENRVRVMVFNVIYWWRKPEKSIDILKIVGRHYIDDHYRKRPSAVKLGEIMT
jgi:hypothetical protein